MQNDIEKLAQCYPQLLLPVRAGMSKTEEFKNAVLAGQIPDAKPDFLCPEEMAA